MKYSIYKITNLVNGKCYIGFTENVDRRWRQHKTNMKNGLSPLYSSFRKHGIDNFTFEVIFESDDRNDALLIKEPYYIKYYDSINHGYNIQEGGNNTNTEELREKNRIRMTQNNPMKIPEIKEKNSGIFKKGRHHIVTDEMRRKIKESKMGKNNPNYKNSNCSIHLNKTEICEHCNKSMNIGNYIRWHGPLCKNKK